MKLICITPFNKMDYLASCIIEGLKDLDVEIIHTDSGNGLLGCNHDDKILSEANTADGVLAFWSKQQAPAPRFHLMDKIDGIPKAYIDGSEYNQRGHPKKESTWLDNSMLNGRADFYFKRECMLDDYEKGVLPLPFAARKQDFAIPIGEHPRTNEIFCAFGQIKIDPIRGKLQSLVKGLQVMSDRPWKVIVGIKDIAKNIHVFTTEQYQHYTASSKICINAHGGGQDCMRFWEIIAGGAACFTQKLDIIMPHPFINGKHIVEFKTANEFKDLANEYLDNPVRLQELAENGYQHLKKYHTTKVRASYMLKQMGLIQ